MSTSLPPVIGQPSTLPPPLKQTKVAISLIEVALGYGGRLSPLPCLLYLIPLNILSFAALIALAPTIATEFGLGEIAVLVIFGIPYVMLVLPAFVKRLHDFNRPGILAVSLLIPYVNVLAAIAIIVIPGTNGPNNYGRPTRVVFKL